MSSKRRFEAVEFSPHGTERGRLTLEGLLQHASKRARCAAPRSTTPVVTAFPYALSPVDVLACTGGEVPLHLKVVATAQPCRLVMRVGTTSSRLRAQASSQGGAGGEVHTSTLRELVGHTPANSLFCAKTYGADGGFNRSAIREYLGACRPLAAIIEIRDADREEHWVDLPGYDAQVVAMEWCSYGLPFAEGVASRLLLAFRGMPGAAGRTASAMREMTVRKPFHYKTFLAPRGDRVREGQQRIALQRAETARQRETLARVKNNKGAAAKVGGDGDCNAGPDGNGENEAQDCQNSGPNGLEPSEGEVKTSVQKTVEDVREQMKQSAYKDYQAEVEKAVANMAKAGLWKEGWQLRPLAERVCGKHIPSGKWENLPEGFWNKPAAQARLDVAVCALAQEHRGVVVVDAQASAKELRNVHCNGSCVPFTATGLAVVADLATFRCRTVAAMEGLAMRGYALQGGLEALANCFNLALVTPHEARTLVAQAPCAAVFACAVLATLAELAR